MDNHELTHWGTKGMKWGIRRYQNKDGSLTPAGRKRYEKEIAKKRQQSLEKARETRARKHAEEIERKKKLAAGKLSPKQMTDDELRDRIARLELEKKYTDAIRDTRATQSKAKRFIDKFVDSTIDKTAENSSADIVAQAIKVVLTAGTNSALSKAGFGDETVFTNNKKK